MTVTGTRMPMAALSSVESPPYVVELRVHAESHRLGRRSLSDCSDCRWGSRRRQADICPILLGMLAGHQIMSESSVILISFARLAGVYVVLLLRMRCLWWVITEGFASAYRSVAIWRTLLLPDRDRFYRSRLRAVYSLVPYRSCYVQRRDT